MIAWDGVRLLCDGKSFADLQVPFACVAVDLESGEEVVFKDGDLEPAVMASASLPMVFPPVYYRDRYLVDGGVRNNLPCGACRELGAEKIIAVSIKNNQVKQKIAGRAFMKSQHAVRRTKGNLAFIVDIFLQTLSIASSCCYAHELEESKPDLLLEVECDTELFAFDKIDDIIALGRKAAEENLDKIRALLRS